MTIEKVTPTVSELTNKQVEQIEKDSEFHPIPFDDMRVDAFFEGALIREAAAQYWEPQHSNGEGKERKQTALYGMLWSVMPQGLAPLYPNRDVYDFPVSLKIVITYPLQEIWEATVKIPANRIGEVFAITHDMYKHIYDLDNANWQEKGHQDVAPRGGGGLLNRAKGKHVWGHDMGDLVFERTCFTPNPNWPTKQEEMDVTKQDLIDGMDSEDKELPARKHKTVLAPLEIKAHKDECPFLGTFTFFIGS